MTTFNGLPTTAIIAAAVSAIQGTGQFGPVNGHEPMNSPGNGLTAAVWVQDIESAPDASGLDGVAAVFVLNVRLYVPARSEPLDTVETDLSTAVDTLMGVYAGGFTFGGLVRNIDIFGEFGTRLKAQYGYVQMEGAVYRCATITVPCIVNDPWQEEQ